MGETTPERADDRARSAPATKAASDAPDDYARTGVMLALYPDEATAKALAIDGGLPRDELHVTVAYVGKTDQVDRSQLLAAARVAAAGRGPIEGRYSGHARFTGGEDGDALVALYDSYDLEELRRAVVAALANSRVDLPTDHGFTAHTTLAYLEPGDASPVERLKPRPATFDRLVAVYGQERVDVSLTGPEDETPAEPVTETKTTAAQLYDRGNVPEDGWATYRKTRPIQAVRIAGEFSVKTREGEISCPDGYLAIDSAGWPYPIAAEEMAQVYEAVPDGPGSLAAKGLPDDVDEEKSKPNPFGKGPIGGGKGEDAGPKIATGAFVALGNRKGRVDLVVTNGTVPGAKLPSGEDVEGTADSPAARVVEYEPSGEGTFKATGRKFASSVAKLKRIAPLRTRQSKSLDEALAQTVVDLDEAGEPIPTVDALRQVYDRGVKSWPGADATVLTAEQWGLGRVDAFAATLAGMRPEGYSGDDDLLPQGVPA